MTLGYFNGDEVTQNFECNHKEVETRMVLHVALSSEDVVVAAAVFYFDNLWLFKVHDQTKMSFEISGWQML